ncbi:MAG: UDP-N-acetylmuramoyl-tripeptide--D-alanyl-D-alanine ligase [Prolixibacteraceae bacterium]|jgi:UDP-N-acetylmuramoyl-tripeptide--D-alanyl-D-alanine ligase|nr:UDP-N-acetylmuramoyl-tripeptide--D-alanyl-D-alanine ligase [Prolixibacteraceae bacterium]
MCDIHKLYRLFLKEQRVFTDSSQTSDGGIFFALRGESFNGNEFALQALSQGASYAVVDDKTLPAHNKLLLVDDVLQTLQKLANYHRRQLSVPIIAITGTNGKTTSKELLHAVLSQKYKVYSTVGNYNNHIGVPLTLLSVNSTHEIAVIEMGANHPGEIAALCEISEPDYGLITNVGKAHLEGFGSFEGVIKTKAELYRFIAEKGRGIFINEDNPHLAEMAKENPIKFTYGSTLSDAQLKGEVLGESMNVTVRALFPKGWLYLKSNLTGNYNFENIMAAARIGSYFEIDPLKISEGIEAYKPDNNRSQLLKKSGADFLVDCYNANPTSMEASVKNFLAVPKKPKLMILGDMLELGDSSSEEHQKIIDMVSNADIEEIYLVGECFYKTKVSSNFKKFRSVDKLIENISGRKWTGYFIFLKGSRGIKLEKILDHI